MHDRNPDIFVLPRYVWHAGVMCGGLLIVALSVKALFSENVSLEALNAKLEISNSRLELAKSAIEVRTAATSAKKARR